MPPTPPHPASPADLPPQPTGTFVMALLGALLGGLLLNLMPCVFPILAIKVLGFARQAGNRQRAPQGGAGLHRRRDAVVPRAGRRHARAARGRRRLGWGFQLQSPGVVAALAALFTLIGLNLVGVFEFGRAAPSSVCSAQAKHPLANDFLSGVLAVVIASPCTAPFMGVSLGFAIGLPAAQALLLFAALGLGLALPYLVAGFVPAIARLLPRPGPWMGTLRRLLAFPMFATVAWLVWVLGQQSGIDGAGTLLALLVCMAAIVWALTLRGRTRLVIAAVLIAFTAVLTAAIGRNVLQTVEPARLASSSAAKGGQRWQPWSAERVTELTGAGQPVFIDFTAAWCVTCQYNKKARWPMPRCWPISTQEGRDAARRLDPPRPRHHRRAHRARPQRRAGVRAAGAGQGAGRADRDSGQGRGPRRARRALTTGVTWVVTCT
jgi:thiol:disulfide interchange protein